MTDTTHELSINRLIAAPRDIVWRCWTEPGLIKQWFTPRPWTTPEVEMDLRPGGASRMLFRGPNGEEFLNRGIYLEVVPQEKLVFTDAYVDAWTPSAEPFMTAIVTFADEGQGTRYEARVRHWTEAARQSHEDRGFHEGWGKAADQLEALARTL
ncbi:SRPBCC family protein [Aestuariivirga sp.]|uniref:SRPBCC family protein n=1 Tax=Aestuariivirga sp. TaxID=2650926 RepID=UPI003BAD089D